MDIMEKWHNGKVLACKGNDFELLPIKVTCHGENLEECVWLGP